MKIFLDDSRVPYDVFRLTINPLYEKNESWVLLEDYNEFVSHINKYGIPDLISFDHDLEQSHYLPINQNNINYRDMTVKCGYHCLEWLINYCQDKKTKLPEILIHSMNIEGKKNMIKLLEMNSYN